MIATAHLILRMICRMLKDRVPFRESGWDYAPHLNRQLTIGLQN